MRLYTIQSEPYWRICQERGYLRPDRTLALRDGWDHFQGPYAWMKEQMAKRLPAFSGHDPVWAWTTPEHVHEVHTYPDRRPYVRLTLEVPEDRVLVSDFGMWHHVLNNCYLGSREEEDLLDRLVEEDYEAWNRQYDEWQADTARKLQGWEHIFDMDRWVEEGHCRPQACIDGVFLHEVVKVKRFMSVLDLEFAPRARS